MKRTSSKFGGLPRALRSDDDRAETIKAIQQGLESMRAGRGMPLHEFAAKIRKKHNLPE